MEHHQEVLREGGEQLHSKGGKIVFSFLSYSCVNCIHIQPSASGTGVHGVGAGAPARGSSLSLWIILETNLMWSSTCSVISSLYSRTPLIQRTPVPISPTLLRLHGEPSAPDLVACLMCVGPVCVFMGVSCCERFRE